MIVLDASAAVAILLDPGPKADLVRKRVESPDESVHVPHLLDLEVAHALRRHALQDRLASQRGVQALRDFANIRMTRYPHASLLERIWDLRHNLTAYDAPYVALAEALNAPLLTGDARLARVPGIRAAVEVYRQ
ncbi:PIN domain-containing protein [soil metagenome]